MESRNTIRWRVGLIVASIALALYQCVAAPTDSLHHADVGVNALLHPLGPILLALVPMLSLLILVRYHVQGTGAKRLHAPTFIMSATAAEAAGVVLGLTHHGVALTLLIAVLGLMSSVLAVAIGASLGMITSRRQARTWSRRACHQRRPSVCIAPPRGWDFTRAHARRGPPGVAGC